MKVLVKLLRFLSYQLVSLETWLRKAKEWKKGDPTKPMTWYKTQVDGAKSSDGSQFCVYFRKGESKNLMVYLCGGGAAWSQYTAARPMSLETVVKQEEGFYFPNLNFYTDYMLYGILENSNSKNPFDSWNVIYIPYTTGDMHVGNREFTYEALDGSKKTLYHNGFANVKLSLELAAPMFPEADRLLIAGESAGAFGSVALGDFIASYWPKTTQVAVYADAAQVWSKKWVEVLRDAWNAEESLWNCLSEDGELIADWFERLSKRLPNAVLLHSNSIFDEVLSKFQNKLNNDTYSFENNALSSFNSHLKDAEQRLTRLKNYSRFVTAIGKTDKETTPHTDCRYPERFYPKGPEGASLAEWLAKACCQPEGMKNPGNVGDEHIKALFEPQTAPNPVNK
ncbi:MAG: pectinacetylesterase family protein [Clostridiales bacterium]|nr:pectinacetylesterase family protein [Clostridiales bacterium]